MKKLLLSLGVAGLFIFQSCEEVGPLIEGVNTVADSTGTDTVYTSAPEAPQAKVVLVEEFTGVSCPNCPAGQAQLKDIKNNLNGDLIIIAYHIENNGFTEPVQKDGNILSKYDFRTPDATEVSKNIYGTISRMPQAGIDRLPEGENNTPALDRANWSNAAERRAAEEVPVNIHLESAFDENTREATVTVKLVYNADVNFKEKITLAVLEDSIVDAQTFTSTKEKEYLHEHVLRDIVTPITGSAVPEKVSPKVPGRVYERTYTFSVDNKWHEEHCHIVAFVSNDEADNRLIVQAAEVKLISK